ncbi:hypothetical protein H1D61_000782 [Salmonella enterica]|nr:hypothetical protein [Salmonella enterica]
MKRSETYYYGQGRVMLGVRTPGQAVNLRWVGDVDQLDISFNSESHKGRQSVNGVTGTATKYFTHHDCGVSANFYEYSAENLGLALFGQSLNQAAHAEQQSIGTGVIAKGRYPLAHQNVWGVFIHGLSEGVDFIVDSLWGVIEFLKTPRVQPVTVRYKHAGNVNIPILTTRPVEVMLRYEGVNLAESMRPVLVELYRVQFNPSETLGIITDGNALGSFELKGDVLPDLTRSATDVMGQYGRFVIVGNIDLSTASNMRVMTTTGIVGGAITTLNPDRK